MAELDDETRESAGDSSLELLSRTVTRVELFPLQKVCARAGASDADADPSDAWEDGPFRVDVAPESRAGAALCENPNFDPESLTEKQASPGGRERHPSGPASARAEDRPRLGAAAATLSFFSPVQTIPSLLGAGPSSGEADGEHV